MASIKERNGAYLITVSLGRDVNGKKIFETATFKPDAGLPPKRKQKAVEAFAASFEEQCKNGLTLDGRKITLKEFIDRWAAERAVQELQASTMEKYQAVIDDFILPHLGHLKLTEIKPHTINSFLSS